MKKYLLLKDLVGVKAGAIIEDEAKIIIEAGRYQHFPDWFEEIKNVWDSRETNPSEVKTIKQQIEEWVEFGKLIPMGRLTTKKYHQAMQALEEARRIMNGAMSSDWTGEREASKEDAKEWLVKWGLNDS